MPLSEAGRARANRLAALLKNAGVTAIYSTDFVRTLETAEPLARALKIEVRKYSATGANGNPDLKPLAARLKAEHPRDTVLVVGHSNTVPPLLKALGCAEDITIAASQYDDLFAVVPRVDGPPVLLRQSSRPRRSDYRGAKSPEVTEGEARRGAERLRGIKRA